MVVRLLTKVGIHFEVGFLFWAVARLITGSVLVGKELEKRPAGDKDEFLPNVRAQLSKNLISSPTRFEFLSHFLIA